MHTILLVEDEAPLRELIGDYFTAKSGGQWRLLPAADGTEGLALQDGLDHRTAVLLGCEVLHRPLPHILLLHVQGGIFQAQLQDLPAAGGGPRGCCWRRASRWIWSFWT